MKVNDIIHSYGQGEHDLVLDTPAPLSQRRTFPLLKRCESLVGAQFSVHAYGHGLLNT